MTLPSRRGSARAIPDAIPHAIAHAIARAIPRIGHRVIKPAPILIALTIAPILVGFLYAAGAMLGVLGPGAEGMTAAHMARVLSSRDTWVSVAWTVMVASIATLAAFWAAVATTESVWNSAMGRRLTLLPFAVPHIAGALAMLLLLGQSGLLSRLLFALGIVQQPSDFPALVYDRFGIGLTLAFFWKEFPFLALTAFAVRSQIPRPYMETVRSLGGSARQVDRMLIRPLVARGVLPAAISVFAFLIGQYEMASVLGPSAPSALSVLTYERITDPDLSRRGEAYVLAVLALTIAAGLAVWYTRIAPVSEDAM